MTCTSSIGCNVNYSVVSVIKMLLQNYFLQEVLDIKLIITILINSINVLLDALWHSFKFDKTKCNSCSSQNFKKLFKRVQKLEYLCIFFLPRQKETKHDV